MRQKSWAVTVPFQTMHHTTVGCCFIRGNSDTIDDDETGKRLVIARLVTRSGGTIVGLLKWHQQEAQRVTTWSRARQH